MPSAIHVVKHVSLHGRCSALETLAYFGNKVWNMVCSSSVLGGQHFLFSGLAMCYCMRQSSYCSYELQGHLWCLLLVSPKILDNDKYNGLFFPSGPNMCTYTMAEQRPHRGPALLPCPPYVP